MRAILSMFLILRAVASNKWWARWKFTWAIARHSACLRVDCSCWREMGSMRWTTARRDGFMRMGSATLAHTSACCAAQPNILATSALTYTSTSNSRSAWSALLAALFVSMASLVKLVKTPLLLPKTIHAFALLTRLFRTICVFAHQDITFLTLLASRTKELSSGSLA